MAADSERQPVPKMFERSDAFVGPAPSATRVFFPARTEPAAVDGKFVAN